MKRTEIIKDMELKQVVGEMPDKITVTKPESVPPKILTALPEGVPPGTKTRPSNWMKPIGDSLPDVNLISGTYVYNPNAPIYSPEAKLTEEQERAFQEGLKSLVKDQTKAATKFDQDKPNWSLVPFEALEDMVRVLEFGAKKYNEGGTSREQWNWAKGKGLGIPRVLAACLRHIFARMRGEINDPESGLPHLGHALCCLLFASFYSKNLEKYDQ